MLAIAVSAAESVGCSVARIYAQSVRFGPRTCAPTRALASDEVLLLRTMAMVEQLGDSTSVVPVVYALMDAGLSVDETIHFAPEDFHVPEGTFPFARVLVWGSSQYEPGVIRCDLFASCLLSRYTSTVLAAGASATEMLGGDTDMQDTSGWGAAERATDFALNGFLDKAGLRHACHGLTSDGSRRARIGDLHEALD